MGEERGKSSIANNPHKIQSFRMAAAAIEKLDLEVQHGDDLRGVRATPATSPFTEPVVESVCPIDQWCRARHQVPD